MDVSKEGLGFFEDGQWDYAIACHVIEHLPNPGRFTGELFRVVRPGGALSLQRPTSGSRSICPVPKPPSKP